VAPSQKNIRFAIIKEADKRFRKYGIRAVTMDDIAHGIHVSKRTIYEAFPNKEKILMGVLRSQIEERDEHMQDFLSNTDNVMDILCEVLRLQIEFSAKTTSSFFTDLVKYPKVEKMMHEYNAKQRGKASDFYKKGVVQGYFRKDIDYVIFNRIMVGLIHVLRATKEFKDLTYQQIFVNCHSIIIRGICTKKGIERFEHFMEENF
jgi:hypothetical protein